MFTSSSLGSGQSDYSPELLDDWSESDESEFEEPSITSFIPET